MRQRTLGILAAAFLLAGAAVGAGTVIYASRSGMALSPAPAEQRGHFHRPQFGGPQLQPGFGPGPGGGPVRQGGGPGF